MASDHYTQQEKLNMTLVRDYMEIAYNPKAASAEAVAPLCAPHNQFIAPTTFPDIHTLEQYAEAHGKMMRELSDLRLLEFSVFFAKDDRVCVRYHAEASHCGEPHNGIEPTHRKASWTACALFRVVDDKLVEFIKEWDKVSMWEQLGWPIEECTRNSKREH